MSTVPNNGVILFDSTGTEVGTTPNPIKASGSFSFTEAAATNMEGGGKVSVGTTSVEVTFTGTTKSIIITADSANTGVLYVGKSNVASDGSNAITYLSAGDSVTIEYNDATNAIYVVASAASQYFWKGALV